MCVITTHPCCILHQQVYTVLVLECCILRGKTAPHTAMRGAGRFGHTKQGTGRRVESTIPAPCYPYCRAAGRQGVQCEATKQAHNSTCLRGCSWCKLPFAMWQAAKQIIIIIITSRCHSQSPQCGDAIGWSGWPLLDPPAVVIHNHACTHSHHVNGWEIKDQDVPPAPPSDGNAGARCIQSRQTNICPNTRVEHRQLGFAAQCGPHPNANPHPQHPKKSTCRLLSTDSLALWYSLTASGWCERRHSA